MPTTGVLWKKSKVLFLFFFFYFVDIATGPSKIKDKKISSHNLVVRDWLLGRIPWENQSNSKLFFSWDVHSTKFLAVVNEAFPCVTVYISPWPFSLLSVSQNTIVRWQVSLYLSFWFLSISLYSIVYLYLFTTCAPARASHGVCTCPQHSPLYSLFSA